jgi:hypothetical protein
MRGDERDPTVVEHLAQFDRRLPRHQQVLFNRHTGFEVLDTEMSAEGFLVPVLSAPGSLRGAVTGGGAQGQWL